MLWCFRSEILLLGSAPYVVDWWADASWCFPDHEVRAINNAWTVPGKRLSVWYHSSDFFALGSNVRGAPKHLQRVNFATTPHWYECPGSGTMLLNCLYDILNTVPMPVEVLVVGSDFDYSGQKTHFYGQGKFSSRTAKQIEENCPDLAGKAADPFRFGKAWLEEELNKVDLLYRSLGCSLLNAGNHEPTLLPFEKLCL